MASAWPPKKGAEFILLFSIRDADGDLVTGAGGLDSEVSKDSGSFADCTNEASEIGTSGIYALTLTSTEMNADRVAVITKTSTSGAKAAATVLYTTESTWDEGIDAKAVLSGAIIAASFAGGAIDAAALAADASAELIAAIQAKTHLGVLQAGAAGTATLASGASSTNDFYKDGMLFVIAADGTVYVASVTAYNGTTKVATVSPNWPVTPDNTYRYVAVAA